MREDQDSIADSAFEEWRSERDNLTVKKWNVGLTWEEEKHYDELIERIRLFPHRLDQLS